MTGIELAETIRAVAHAHGESLQTFCAPITKYGASFVSNIQNAKRPREETLQQLRHLFDARGIPLPAALRSAARAPLSPTGLPLRAAIAGLRTVERLAAASRSNMLARAPQQSAGDSEAFAVVRAAAEAGEPCPSRQKIAARLGVSASCVDDRLRRLEAGGRITIVRRTPLVVTIVATGQTTSLAPAKPTDRPPVIVPEIVDREPCFRCGVRGDIGCQHRPLEMRS